MVRRAELKHGLSLTAVAFALHLVWESVQCSVFYVHGSFDATWIGMARAAAGDVVISWLLYAAVALASRSWTWTSRPWTFGRCGVLVLAAFLIAVAVELYALHTGRWAYRANVPTLPGIGVSAIPILQLVMLSPIVFALAELISGRTQDATQITRGRYDRVAPIYDGLEWVLELRFRRWRRRLWQLVPDGHVLELGVGTGKNVPFYPAGQSITALDLSERMLVRASRRVAKRGAARVSLVLGDAQALPFADRSFDCVVATFLFCSVPDQLAALRESLRVLKPGGRLYMIEHVLSERRVLRTLMRWFDFVPHWLWGAHINRETVAAVQDAGFRIAEDSNLSLDVVKRIVALAPESHVDCEKTTGTVSRSHRCRAKVA